nr:RNA-directed DNA polymerase, eukaryota [Tanacetum cinerariifolium]
MGRFRTKEDDVAKISTSVYISNIPESVFAKDLFHACKQYGHVVDSFIPVKRDKMFKDLSLALLGRVKEFASLDNLKMAIGNEGFADIIIKYMGEMWVMLEFQSMETLNKFRKNVSIASWFSQIINASSDFETEGRIAWVEIEGVPFKLWSGKTFSRIASKWGKFLDVDDQEDNCYHSKRICVYMKSGMSIKDEFNIIHRGKKYWIRAVETAGWVPNLTEENDDDDHDDVNSNKDGSDILRSGDVGNFKTGFDTGYDSEEEAVHETFFEKEESDKVDSHMDKSEDPFNIYPLLNKTKINDEGVNISDCSMQYPPGFTPPLEKDEACINEDVENKLHNSVEVNKDNSKNVKDDVSSRHGNSNIKEAENEASSLGHFKKSDCPRMDGSILGLLEEVVKVGQRQTNSVGFLQYEICKWKGEVIIISDFNEVRYKEDMFGSSFNAHGANLFNSFISTAGLIEVSLGGSHFTWCHKSAKKISKLDRFLVLEILLVSCPQLNTITLERFWSDHRPILLQENHYDYGPTPFWFFHHWIEMDGFCKLVEDTWKNNLCGFECYEGSDEKNMKAKYKLDLEDVDRIIDSGHGTKNKIRSRSDIILKLQHCEEIDSMEMAQKAKIKWAVEGDENTKFFHGMLNKKRNILSIREVMVDGVWVDDPKGVKNEFFDHFSKRFCKPNECRVTLSMDFPNRLQSYQRSELEAKVTNEEIKKAVWDCGTDKAPGPDGFTFCFFRKFWYLVDKEVFDAVRYEFDFAGMRLQHQQCTCIEKVRTKR